MTNKGGRPRYQPTEKDRNFVRIMAGFGIAQTTICLAIGVKSEKTLRVHFKKEMNEGAAQVEGRLASSLLAIATNKNQDGTTLKAIMFILQSRFGWSMYAAPPPEPKIPELGKKQTLELEARTGHENTGWGELLN